MTQNGLDWRDAVGPPREETSPLIALISTGRAVDLPHLVRGGFAGPRGGPLGARAPSFREGSAASVVVLDIGQSAGGEIPNSPDQICTRRVTFPPKGMIPTVGGRFAT